MGLTAAERERALRAAPPTRSRPMTFEQRILKSRLDSVERKLIETGTGRRWSDMERAFGGRRNFAGRLAALRCYAAAHGLDEIRHAVDALTRRPPAVSGRGVDQMNCGR